MQMLEQLLIEPSTASFDAPECRPDTVVSRPTAMMIRRTGSWRGSRRPTKQKRLACVLRRGSTRDTRIPRRHTHPAAGRPGPVTHKCTRAAHPFRPRRSTLVNVMGAFAEFERSLIRERQREGIALAKTRGLYRGRTPSLDTARAAELREKAAAGVPKSVLARQFGISRETVYVYLGAGD